MVVLTALAIVMMSFVMLVSFVVAAAFVFFVVVVTTFAVMFRHSDSMLGVDVRIDSSRLDLFFVVCVH